MFYQRTSTRKELEPYSRYNSALMVLYSMILQCCLKRHQDCSESV